MSIKVIVTGTGKDGTTTISELIRQISYANGECFDVRHEPDTFPIIQNITNYLETKNESYKDNIREIVKAWDFDVAVSGSFDFCLDIFHEIFGSNLKVIHLKRNREDYLRSVLHSTRAKHESHGNYLTDKNFTLYRPAGFHYGAFTKKDWFALPLEDRFNWFYDKVHELFDDNCNLFAQSLTVKTDSLSDPTTIRKIVSFIDSNWQHVPEPVHENAMRLINYDILTREQRIHFHKHFVRFNILQFFKSSAYAAKYFMRYVDIEKGLETNDNNLYHLKRAAEKLIKDIEELEKK